MRFCKQIIISKITIFNKMLLYTFEYDQFSKYRFHYYVELFYWCPEFSVFFSIKIIFEKKIFFKQGFHMWLLLLKY